MGVRVEVGLEVAQKMVVGAPGCDRVGQDQRRRLRRPPAPESDRRHVCPRGRGSSSKMGRRRTPALRLKNVCASRTGHSMAQEEATPPWPRTTQYGIIVAGVACKESGESIKKL